MATLIAPLVVIALVILRNMRARRLRIESLWLAPTLIIVAVALQFSQEGTPTPLALGVDIGAFVVGALLGWWRARFTHITIDPATHQLTSRASPIGMLVVLALFALRYVLRVYAVQNAGSIGLPVNVVADGALVISVGLVCAQRLEIALRATRLLNEARSGGASPAP
ncbi:MAG TPA: hypothetical protein VHW05_16135 [Phenylobacterium sp.]|jgi:hypothetical protein|nr:hypothetical protein [Phenylobacterium sp.]